MIHTFGTMIPVIPHLLKKKTFCLALKYLAYDYDIYIYKGDVGEKI